MYIHHIWYIFSCRKKGQRPEITPANNYGVEVFQTFTTMVAAEHKTGFLSRSGRLSSKTQRGFWPSTRFLEKKVSETSNSTLALTETCNSLLRYLCDRQRLASAHFWTCIGRSATMDAFLNVTKLFLRLQMSISSKCCSSLSSMRCVADRVQVASAFVTISERIETCNDCQQGTEFHLCISIFTFIGVVVLSRVDFDVASFISDRLCTVQNTQRLSRTKSTSNL